MARLRVPGSEAVKGRPVRGAARAKRGPWQRANRPQPEAMPATQHTGVWRTRDATRRHKPRTASPVL